jgi:hypothetical protein
MRFDGVSDLIHTSVVVQKFSSLLLRVRKERVPRALGIHQSAAAHESGCGPTLPSAASAGYGSCLGISCRHWGRRTTAEDDSEQPIVAAATKKFLQRHSPVHASTYVENVAGQVGPLVRERLPAQL